MTIKPSHRGKFTAYKKKTGKSTSQALKSKDPEVRSMANFARMAKRGWKPLAFGGDLDDPIQKRSIQKRLNQGEDLHNYDVPTLIDMLDNTAAKMSDLYSWTSGDLQTQLVKTKQNKLDSIYKELSKRPKYKGKPANVDAITYALGGDFIKPIEVTGLDPFSQNYDTTRITPNFDINLSPSKISDQIGEIKRTIDEKASYKNRNQSGIDEMYNWMNNYRVAMDPNLSSPVKEFQRQFGPNASSTTPTAYQQMRNIKKLSRRDFGGWLSRNAGNLLQVGAGAALTATGVGAGAGIGMMTSGGLGMVNNAMTPENEVSQIYKPATSKSRRIYDTTIGAGGGNLKKLSQRTDYIGDRHEQGGVDLPMENGVQVEGGENQFGGIVNSDRIVVTPAIMKRYNLKKSDLGKTIAKVAKSRDKKFEKRSGDQMNDEARLAVQKPISNMSDELSQIYQIAQEMNTDQPDNIQVNPTLDMKKCGGKLKTKRMMGKGGKLHKKYGMNQLNLPGDSQMMMADGGDLLGYAPAIGNAALGLISALTPVEKVKYEQAKFTPTEFTPMDTTVGISRIKQSFGNTRESLRKLNPRMLLNNLGNIGASEAQTIGDYTGQVGNANTAQLNQSRSYDSMNRSRLQTANTQIAMEETQANAQNRGAKRTATLGYLANAATQAGQISRDSKFQASQEKYQNRMADLYEKHQSIGGTNFSIPGDSFDIQNIPYEDLSTNDPTLLYNKIGPRVNAYGGPLGGLKSGATFPRRPVKVLPNLFKTF